VITLLRSKDRQSRSRKRNAKPSLVNEDQDGAHRYLARLDNPGSEVDGTKLRGSREISHSAGLKAQCYRGEL